MQSVMNMISGACSLSWSLQGGSPSRVLNHMQKQDTDSVPCCRTWQLTSNTSGNKCFNKILSLVIIIWCVFP